MSDPNEPTPQARRSYHHGGLRDALLVAGEAELREKGIEGFTLRSCAKRAGVSHGAPAHHFSDANALLTALAATGYRLFLAAQQQRKQAAPADPASQLLAAGLGYLDFARQNPDMFRLVFSSTRIDHADPDLAAAASAAFEQLVADVAAVTDADPYRSPTGLVDVSAVWSLVHGAAELMIGGRLPIPQDDPDAAERILHTLLTRAVSLVTPASA